MGKSLVSCFFETQCMYTNAEGDATDLHQLDRHFVGVTCRAGKNRFFNDC